MSTAIFALLAFGCGPPATAPVEAPTDVGWDVVPVETESPTRRIDALDLAVDASGDLHLVYRLAEVAADVEAGSGLPTVRVVHRLGVHRDDPEQGLHWSAGVVVEAAGEGPARLAVGDEGLHLVAGRRLAHLVRGVDGRWTALGEILDGDRLAAESNRSSLADFRPAFDLLALPDGLRVAVLSRAGRESPLTLNLIRRLGAETVSSRRLADHPAASERQPAPRLVRDDDGTLHLVWATAEEIVVERLAGSVPDGQAPAEVSRHESKLFYSRSEGGGPRAGASAEEWAEPGRIDHAAGGVERAIHDVELYVRDGRPTILFSSFGLFVTRSADGRSWSTPRAVGGTDANVGDPASLQVAGGLLVWTDQRLRDTGRRWWKPLGGWPWSDGTGRLDNDIFLLATAALDGAPRHQTPGRSFTALARLADCGDHVHLIWAGHRPAETTPRSEIFHRRLALDDLGD